MNIYELAERDLRHATMHLNNAKHKPNVPDFELKHHEELVKLRTKIFRILNSRTLRPGDRYKDAAGETHVIESLRIFTGIDTLRVDVALIGSEAPDTIKICSLEEFKKNFTEVNE